MIYAELRLRGVPVVWLRQRRGQMLAGFLELFNI